MKIVNCLVREISFKGRYTTYDYIPVCIIERDYGTVENLIKEDQERYTSGTTKHYYKFSNDYNPRYEKYINALEVNNKIQKAIDYVSSFDNIINKNEVLEYLNNLV